MLKLNWQAFSTGERNQVMESVKGIIAKNEGYIISFNLFSDLAINLNVEIEERHIPGLYNCLSDILTIKEPTPEGLNANSTKEGWVLIHLSFVQGKGDFEVDIPAVPG